MLQHVPLVIGGEDRAAGSGGQAETCDPATGEVLATVALASEREVDEAVGAARASSESGVWRRMRPSDRGRLMLRIAALLLEARDELAALESRDSGKPLRDAYWEVDCSARFFEFYGGYCDKIQGTTVPLGPEWMDWTVKEPIGVSAQIVPWNYPLQVAVRGIAPALAVGCSVVAKPATETPLSLYRFSRICTEAGLPAGVLNVLPGRGSVVGEALVRHPGVDQVTFTGSVETGKRVMVAAASHVIPLNLEMGGKSPQIVFEDADLEVAIPVLAGGVFTHAGQVCNAGTRLLVAEAIQKRVVERLHEHMQRMRLGRGLDDPDMGPLISAGHRASVEGYIEIGRSEGMVLQGGILPSDPLLAAGNFVRPTMITGVDNRARVAREEIFGPVLTVIPFTSADEALRIANDSDFGLVAGVFTRDLNLAMRASQELRAGQVWVNSFGVGLDVEFPFGGYKQSGFGREKGLEALGAYTQVKNTCVRIT